MSDIYSFGLSINNYVRIPSLSVKTARGYFIELEKVNSQVAFKIKKRILLQTPLYKIFINEKSKCLLSKYFINLIFNVAKIYIFKKFYIFFALKLFLKNFFGTDII